MASEQTLMNGILRDLIDYRVYKPSQGRRARQATCVALWVVVALGAWRLNRFLLTSGPTAQYVAPLVALAVGLWLAYRAVNWPKFADFLIAVEAEINKVSWPTRTELWRSSLVVILTIFILGTLLFVYDIVWRLVLQLLGITGGQ